MKTPRHDDDFVPIDADIADALSAGHVADAVLPRSAARIKRRLLERVAQAESRHLTVQAADPGWQRFLDGIDIKVLHEGDDGVMSYLLRFAPGAVLGAHRHPVDEECVVLEGSLCIGDDLVVPAGGFHLARRDMLHAPITTVTGATIFLRGASPHPVQLV